MRNLFSMANMAAARKRPIPSQVNLVTMVFSLFNTPHGESNCLFAFFVFDVANFFLFLLNNRPRVSRVKTTTLPGSFTASFPHTNLC